MSTLAAEPILHLGPVTITNTVTNTILVDIILIVLAVFISKKASLIPSFFQGIIEMAVDGFYNLTHSVAGERTMKIFPYVMTFFLFILVANWSGLLPVITAFGFWEHGDHGDIFVPYVRAASTDLNVTLALALVSLVATHTMSITTLGLKSYISRFVSLNPLALYTGILELISEFTKIISFSFRLFGNIFVGEVMLASLSAVFAFVLPIPIIMYEMFVGVIQATIFGLLTMAFMGIFTTPHGEGSKH
jgi:F-type H+-transporting ATPase subunit a